MSAMSQLLDNLVPASDLQRNTSAALDKVHVGSPVVVMRRGVPAAVMITPDEWRDYERLREEAEDAADLALAEERLERWDGRIESLIPERQLWDELGVTERDLDGLEIEFD